MTTTTNEVLEALRQIQVDPTADDETTLRQVAAGLEPLVTQLLADATAHGFRQGFQAGRTLTRQRGMS